MTEKKYQVFISSTYTDLVEARTKVRDAILSMYHFPVGMELFGAANEEQWQIISETIDSSDYYVLIIGQRYGSVIKEGPDAGLSYTEKEFRYALEKGIPVLVFILDDSVPVTPDNIENEFPDKLKAFKNHAKKGRLVVWWKSPDDLAQKVTSALYKQITRTKRPGWIRGGKVDVERSLNTITELTERNLKIVDENKQLLEMVKRLEFLERLVCDGKKYIDSKATVSFDTELNRYILSFEKRYFVISETIKWYEGQLYCNRFLNNPEKSKDYYKTHRLDWAALNFQAKLRYKNIEDTHFSRETQVVVQCVAEDNNYKKYQIQYKTKDGDKLNVKQGTEIILKYSYEVPVSIWGSYLNRYISYWNETASVMFTFTDYSQISKEYFKVYQTDKNGEKYLCEDAAVSENDLDNRREILFSLPQKPASQFSIWWDADRVFKTKGLNTIMVADKSQLSRY